jgi:type III secretory pathway component EscT
LCALLYDAPPPDCFLADLYGSSDIDSIMDDNNNEAAAVMIFPVNRYVLLISLFKLILAPYADQLDVFILCHVDFGN